MYRTDQGIALWRLTSRLLLFLPPTPQKTSDKTSVNLDLNFAFNAVSYRRVPQCFRKKQTFIVSFSLGTSAVKAASHLEEPGIQAPTYADSTKANKLKSKYLNHKVHLLYSSSLP